MGFYKVVLTLPVANYAELALTRDPPKLNPKTTLRFSPPIHNPSITATHTTVTMAPQKRSERSERTSLSIGLNKGHVRPSPSHLLEDPFSDPKAMDWLTMHLDIEN
jgi:hypothetical protein